MDVLTNLMPAYFNSMPDASLSIVRGLMRHDAPVTFEEMFAEIDAVQVVVVTGEEDNVYTPGYVEKWNGLTAFGAVKRGEEKRYLTPWLQPGDYVIRLWQDGAYPTGDADLYVGLDADPTVSSYGYAPYLEGSDEEVSLHLDEPTRLHLMVRGYEDSAAAVQHFLLEAEAAKP
jgi:hypothetical protein